MSKTPKKKFSIPFKTPTRTCPPSNNKKGPDHNTQGEDLLSRIDGVASGTNQHPSNHSGDLGNLRVYPRTKTMKQPRTAIEGTQGLVKKRKSNYRDVEVSHRAVFRGDTVEALASSQGELSLTVAHSGVRLQRMSAKQSQRMTVDPGEKAMPFAKDGFLMTDERSTTNGERGVRNLAAYGKMDSNAIFKNRKATPVYSYSKTADEIHKERHHHPHKSTGISSGSEISSEAEKEDLYEFPLSPATMNQQRRKKQKKMGDHELQTKSRLLKTISKMRDEIYEWREYGKRLQLELRYSNASLHRRSDRAVPQLAFQTAAIQVQATSASDQLRAIQYSLGQSASLTEEKVGFFESYRHSDGRPLLEISDPFEE